MRADEFIVKHLTILEGELKLTASNVCIQDSITVDDDNGLDDMNIPVEHSVDLSVETSGKDGVSNSTSCPECAIGNVPGGAHACISCKKPVHIIFDTCSRPIDNEEGYGQKRICIQCF